MKDPTAQEEYIFLHLINTDQRNTSPTHWCRYASPTLEWLKDLFIIYLFICLVKLCSPELWFICQFMLQN